MKDNIKRCPKCGAGPLGNCGFHGFETPRNTCPFLPPPPSPAKNVMGDGEASIIECLAAGKPFVFDPATNFLHADDGTVEGGIRYMPVPAHHTGRLLPCPFCGGEPEFQESNPYDQSDDVAFTVFCRECGTEHPWRSTPEDAVAFWNRRAALSAEVEG